MTGVSASTQGSHAPSTSAEPAVIARGLTKRYGDLIAVDNLDLVVPRGSFFGILGPNGAGKTSTMKMVACVSPPNSGELTVLGMNLAGNARDIKRRTGVVPQGVTLDVDLTVRATLLQQGRYHGMARRDIESRAEALLESAALTAKADARPDELSGGMQRRLLIARALMSDPDLVILDEPTTGLDPQARHFVWEQLRRLKLQGKTMILTTHYMDEAAHLCDDLVVMDHGKIIARGKPSDLVDNHVSARVVEVHNPEQDAITFERALLGVVDHVEHISDRILLYARDGEAVASRLRDRGLEGTTLLVRDATLEDVFLRLTGHALTD